MDNTNITLLIAKNELIVDDRTVLPDNFGGVNNEYVAIEFVTYANSNVALGLKICKSSECGSARILLDNDGLYYYHKLYIPNISYFTNSDDDIVGEVFVYRHVGENNKEEYKLYKIKESPSGSQTLLDVSEEITPAQAYESAVNAWENSSTQTIYIAKKPAFCIWNIRRCLADIQQELLLNDYKNECNTNKALRNKRDFLFGAAYVLDYLSSTCNYKEAQRVLDNLSSCGFLCGDSTVNTKTCCCGNTL
jgi:hypothetical protein